MSLRRVARARRATATDMHGDHTLPPTLHQRTEALVRRTGRVAGGRAYLAGARHAVEQLSAARRLLGDSAAAVPYVRPTSRPAATAPAAAPGSDTPGDNARHVQLTHSGTTAWFGEPVGPTGRARTPGADTPPPSAVTASALSRPRGNDLSVAPYPAGPRAPVSRPAGPGRAPVSVRLVASSAAPPDPATSSADEPATHGAPNTPPARPRPAAGGPGLQPRSRPRQTPGSLVRVVAQTASDDASSRSAEIDRVDGLEWAVARSRQGHPPATPIEAAVHRGSTGAFEHEPLLGRDPSTAVSGALQAPDAARAAAPPPAAPMNTGSLQPRRRMPFATALPPPETRPAPPPAPLRQLMPTGMVETDLTGPSPAAWAGPEHAVEHVAGQDGRAAWETGDDELHRLSEQLERLFRDEARRHGVQL